MKKFSIAMFSILLLFVVGMEIDDIIEPSDSGDMLTLNYYLTKFKADRGDVNSKFHLLSYYKYNSESPNKTSALILELINSGYGGKKNGREGIVVDLIDECEIKRSISSEEVLKSFQKIDTDGGGLTEYGRRIENRWRNDEFPGCPFPKNK